MLYIFHIFCKRFFLYCKTDPHNYDVNQFETTKASTGQHNAIQSSKKHANKAAIRRTEEGRRNGEQNGINNRHEHSEEYFRHPLSQLLEH